MVWILRLVEMGAEGEGQAQAVMEIDRSGGLGDIAALGLTLSETKQLLAALQQEIVAAQALCVRSRVISPRKSGESAFSVSSVKTGT